MPYRPALESLESRLCPTATAWADFKAALKSIELTEFTLLQGAKNLAVIRLPDITSALTADKAALNMWVNQWADVLDTAHNLQSQVPPSGFPSSLRLYINTVVRVAATEESNLTEQWADVNDALANIRDGQDPGAEAATVLDEWRFDEVPLVADRRQASRTLLQRLDASPPVPRILISEAFAESYYTKNALEWQQATIAALEGLLPATGVDGGP